MSDEEEGNIMARYNPVLDALPTYPQQALNQRKAKVRAQGKTLYDFGVGDPIEPVPKFIRNALKEALPPHCGYPTVRGPQEFRESVVGYVKRRYGTELDPDVHVVPVSGAKEAVFHAPMLFIDPQAEDRYVLFPDPGYPAYYRGAKFAGGIPHPVPLSGDYVFRPWTLPEELLKKTRIIWLNSPHNPSGVSMSHEDLQKTVEICKKYDIVCISDETYADIYDTDPPASLLEGDLTNVLVIHSLSKRSGMTGYRSGFVAGDPEIMQRLIRFRANPGLVPQTFVTKAATLAWGDDDHVAERRALFSKKKSLFLSFFDQQGWEVLGREASLYLWLRVPTGQTGEEYAIDLLNLGIVVSPGSMFAITDAGSNYVRLAMVPDIEGCVEAIQIWSQHIQQS